MSRIDYDLTRIRAVAFDVDGVLSPSTVPLDHDGQPVRMVNIKDGYALQLAVKNGMRLAVITGAKTPAIIDRYRSLGLTDIFIGVSNKLPVYEKWIEDCDLAPDEVAYVGDDIPDLEIMRICGLGVAPLDAAPDIKEVARYISPVNGGYGVARDLLEQILRAHGKWLNSADAFGW